MGAISGAVLAVNTALLMRAIVPLIFLLFLILRRSSMG